MVFDKLAKFRDKLTEYEHKKEEQAAVKQEQNAKQAAIDEAAYKKELEYRQTIQHSRDTRKQLIQARRNTPITPLEKIGSFGLKTAKGAAVVLKKAAEYKATPQRTARPQRNIIKSKPPKTLTFNELKKAETPSGLSFFKKKKLSRWF